MLGYLIRVGKPVSRQRLSRIFWPHLPNSDSRTYLRNILARLKRDFSPWLQITRDEVSFVVTDQSCTVDLYELEAVLARYQHEIFNELNVDQLAEFRDGLALYEGPFMGDFSRTISPWFEEWLTYERQYILERVQSGYAQLIECGIYHEEWGACISDAKKLIGLDPDHQESWLLLMKCLARSGDLRRAQAAYERYERSSAADFRQSETGREMSLLYRKIGQRISGINLDFNQDGDLNIGGR
ncbi:MAG: BTAD domain-containing putative transcriptional regulator [Anaerolineae bacterium]